MATLTSASASNDDRFERPTHVVKEAMALLARPA
jgi:hypothetical protein